MKRSSIRLFAYPNADARRSMKFVAAPSLGAARKFHQEARAPKTEELEAAVADLMYVPLVNTRGKAETARPAAAGDFVAAERLPMTGTGGGA